MAHDGAGQCTSDCRRIGCPDDDEEEELDVNPMTGKPTQYHLNNCVGCAICEI